MPTPSEHAAQLSLPTLSHSERATHGICPPDHAVSRIADDAPPDPDINNGNGSPRRRHDDPQQPAELGNSTPMETTSDTENNNTSPASVKMPTLDEVEGYFSSSSGEFYEESSRESSMSVEEDRAHGTEQHQSTMTSSLQQQNTSSSCSTEVNDGVPNIRVSPTSLRCIEMKLTYPDHPPHNVLLPSPRKQIPRPATIRQANLPSRSRNKIRRHGRIDLMRLPQNRR